MSKKALFGVIFLFLVAAVLLGMGVTALITPDPCSYRARPGEIPPVLCHNGIPIVPPGEQSREEEIKEITEIIKEIGGGRCLTTQEAEEIIEELTKSLEEER